MHILCMMSFFPRTKRFIEGLARISHRGSVIVPGYGGSNFAIPVEYARRLVDAAGIDRE